jgi:5-methylthioadenosine/S-adenosylhomocysteine deaminase
MAVDLAIHDALVLTADERNRLYERGTVCITDGCIEEVRPSRAGDGELEASTVIDGNGKLVMPGLVNAHTHLEMTPLIGALGNGRLRSRSLFSPTHQRSLQNASSLRASCPPR